MITNWWRTIGFRPWHSGFKPLWFVLHVASDLQCRTHDAWAVCNRIQDALLRLVILRSFLGRELVSMLEIGTLFGLDIACAWDLSSVLQWSFPRRSLIRWMAIIRTERMTLRHPCQ